MHDSTRSKTSSLKLAAAVLPTLAAAQVVAEVVYTTLSIESGAQVEGTFKRKKA